MSIYWAANNLTDETQYLFDTFEEAQQMASIAKTTARVQGWNECAWVVYRIEVSTIDEALSHFSEVQRIKVRQAI